MPVGILRVVASPIWVRSEPELLGLLVPWFHLCSVFSSLSSFLPPWLSGALCCEATPTAGTVPAAEVMGLAWDSAGAAQPGGRAPDESMPQTHPFSGWEARLSRRMWAEDGSGGHQTHSPL